MSDKMNTTGDLRRSLAECFLEARAGTLTGDALRGVIGCANQINTSFAVEAKARAALVKEGATPPAFGALKLASGR